MAEFPIFGFTDTNYNRGQSMIEMDLFPEWYEGYVPTPTKAVEVDDELGLEIVERETVYSKYGVYLKQGNSFHDSLQNFFDKAGFLTDKQLKAVRG